jgi:hypothetical protein
MDAISVYRRLYDAGLSLSAAGQKLLAAPASRLTDELRDLIRDNKPQLMSLLAESHKTTADLLAAAMRACDQYGDSEQAREQMRSDCMTTPLHLRADLLAHLNKAYRAKP